MPASGSEPSRPSSSNRPPPRTTATNPRQLEGDVAARDRGAARAAVGLQDVAVDVDGALAEGLEVDHAAQGAPDQALDLDGAPVGPALGHVALLALAGGGGEHPVLRGQPA